jgi:Cytochrome c553
MDLDPPTPVERAVARKRWIRCIVVVLVVLLGLYYLIFVNQYVVAFEDDTEHFKHGSIGSEVVNGLPFWVFKALPVMYAAQLGPTGYRRVGLLYESEQAELPIGMSRRVVNGFELVWLNCAVCHTGTYRLTPNGERHLVFGAPANNLRLQELIEFFLMVANDPQFTADHLLATINSPAVGGDFNVLDNFLYRYLVFPRVQDGLKRLSTQLSFIHRQHDWGPGRVDTFNPYKAIQFNFPMDPAHITEIELNGASDYPSIWRQRPREGMNLHWDGDNSSVAERNLSAALGAGVTPVSVDRPAIQRIEGWMWELPAPTFPVPSAIDATLVDRGRSLFAQYCSACHGMKEAGADRYDYDTRRFPRLGQVEPLARIGTDRGRWASYTEDFAAAQNTLYAGYPWRFSHFRKTDGYANQPLDGIWARSPYLHNGSVPNLRALLEPASARPGRWYRGSDLFDPVAVGYRSDGYGAAPETLFLYDTSIPGNGNNGHEGPAYGTTLPATDKDAIVEYMKTL